MRNAQLTNITAGLVQKMFAAVAIGAIALAFVGAGSAHADIKQGSGGSAGCQIENNGKVETVPVGTKIGLFTCGEDGEWHFGWLINAIKAPSKTLQPSGPAPVHHGVLQVARTRAAHRTAVHSAPDLRPAPLMRHVPPWDEPVAATPGRRQSATADPLRLGAWRTTSSSAANSATT